MMLRLIIFGLMVSAAFATDAKTHFSLTYSTSSIQYVKDGSTYVVYYNATCSLANLGAYDAGIDSWTVEFTTADDSLADIPTGSTSPTVVTLCSSSNPVNDSDGTIHDASVTVRGRFVGITTMKAVLKPTSGSSKSEETLDGTVEVQVIRNVTSVGKILGNIILALMVINNFWWGTQFDFEEGKKCLKCPIAIFLALFLQYIFMPSWSYAVGSMFHQPDGTLLAFLGVAAAHSSGPIHFLVMLTYGNLSLSLLINAFSVTLSFAAYPWWMLTVGETFHSPLSLPWETIGKNWGVFVCPLLGGMLLQYLVPKCKMPISKILFPTNAMQLILSLVTGIVTNYYQFRFFSATNVFNGMLVPYGTLATAMCLAAGFKYKKPEILSIGFTTPLKDAGLIIPVMHHAYHGPFADLYIAPVLISAFVTPYVIIPYVLYIRCYKEKCRKACLKKKEGDTDTEAANGDVNGDAKGPKESDDNKVVPANGNAAGSDNKAFEKTEL